MKIPQFLCRFLARWHRYYCESRPPDFIIGTAEDPYIRRWYLIPRNKWIGVYLHEILRDDEDRALHDHKMVNCSLIVEGEYMEVEPKDRRSYAQDLRVFPHMAIEKISLRECGAIRFRLPSQPHRLVQIKDQAGKPLPARSIFLMGPYVREWGFWCPNGWRPWREFVNMASIGEVGPGCD